MHELQHYLKDLGADIVATDDKLKEALGDFHSRMVTCQNEYKLLLCVPSLNCCFLGSSRLHWDFVRMCPCCS